MNALDRYVGRIVAGSYGAATVFFLFLSITIDLLNGLSSYLDHAERQGLGWLGLTRYLASYYAQMMPHFFVTVAPFISVIACMFATGRLLAANEVVPMLFVGRSTRRILQPMLVCAMLSGLAMAACWQWVVPKFASTISQAQQLLRGGEAEVKGIVMEQDGNVQSRLYVAKYHPMTRTMTGVALLVETVLASETRLVMAETAVWDREQGDWRLTEGTVQTPPSVDFQGVVEPGRTEPCAWLGLAHVAPDDLLRKGREDVDPDLLSYGELTSLIDERPNRTDAKLALHRHVTYPLANLILVLLSLPLAVWFERGSRIERTLGAIGLCGAYLLTDLTCMSLGTREFLPPGVAGWLPTVVFGSLGVVMYGGMRT